MSETIDINVNADASQAVAELEKVATPSRRATRAARSLRRAGVIRSEWLPGMAGRGGEG